MTQTACLGRKLGEKGQTPLSELREDRETTWFVWLVTANCLLPRSLLEDVDSLKDMILWAFWLFRYSCMLLDIKT